MPPKRGKVGRKGKENAVEELPQQVLDFRAQALERYAEMEGILALMLEEDERRSQALLDSMDPALLDMPFLDFLDDPGCYRDGKVPTQDPFVFNEDGKEQMDNTTLGNATAFGEETFMLPKVPATGRGKKSTRPPKTMSHHQALALKTPAHPAHLNPNHMPLMTPATELRAPRYGEVMFSARGSPLFAGAGEAVPIGSGGHANTIIQTRRGQATVVTDSPFDPTKAGPSIDLDDTEKLRLRNLHAKIGAMLD